MINLCVAMKQIMSWQAWGLLLCDYTYIGTTVSRAIRVSAPAAPYSLGASLEGGSIGSAELVRSPVEHSWIWSVCHLHFNQQGQLGNRQALSVASPTHLPSWPLKSRTRTDSPTWMFCERAVVLLLWCSCLTLCSFTSSPLIGIELMEVSLQLLSE